MATITLTWDNPTPHPTCGYKAFYRRNGDPTYTEVDTSGSTSGTTTVTATIAAPACIEGYVQSNCCDGFLSTELPFGINTYGTFAVDIVVDVPNQQFVGTVTTDYVQPYDVEISGEISYTVNGDPFTVVYSMTLVAGELSSTQNLGFVSASAIIVSYNVQANNPVFDYGGQLQQFDAISTPSYIGLYWDETTGTTWTGDPAALPSFNLQAFNITEIDTDTGLTLQGDLLCSWIYDSLYDGGAAPYNLITFEVTDPDSNVLGSVTIDPTVLGLRNTTISLTLADNAYPFDDTTLFIMEIFGSDGVRFGSHEFYIPVP
jgi:hypothetical protein